jgi:hypothetical protein
MNLESRLKSLEESTPGGYSTYDQAGAVVIDSPLPALRWYEWAVNLLREPGHAEEKRMLRAQLARSVRAADGGHLFEVVCAFAAGPAECSENPPAEEGGAD